MFVVCSCPLIKFPGLWCLTQPRAAGCFECVSIYISLFFKFRYQYVILSHFERKTNLFNSAPRLSLNRFSTSSYHPCVTWLSLLYPYITEATRLPLSLQAELPLRAELGCTLHWYQQDHQHGIPTCFGYSSSSSRTPPTDLGLPRGLSPPQFACWLLAGETICRTDGWFKSTWKSAEIFLLFCMSKSENVTKNGSTCRSRWVARVNTFCNRKQHSSCSIKSNVICQKA